MSAFLLIIEVEVLSCKNNSMKKWIPLFLFLVFAHDIAIDAFDADCQDVSATCHSCVCSTHFVNPVATTNEKVSAKAEYIPSPDSLLSFSDFSKSFFHPPKALA
jgi:hypothetical protein